MTKATDIDSEDFDIRAFTREGIGVIMLDTKPTSVRELLIRYRNKDAKDMNRSSSPVKSMANKRMIGLVKELTQITHELNQGEGYKYLHTRLEKMGLDIDGKPIEGTTIFSPAERAEVKNLLTKMQAEGDPRYDHLWRFLSAITSDINLGYLNVASFDEPAEIQDFFAEEDPALRKKFYDEVIATSTDDKVIASAAKFGITATNLFPGISGTGVVGQVSGLVIIDALTQAPIITNNNGDAITFIPPGTLGTDGHEAVFHMLQFVRLMNTSVTGYGEGDAEQLADLFDYIMRNFSSPGTLRKGILWSGKVTTGLADSTLKVGLLDEEYTDEMLTTTVKEIHDPAVMVNINNLIKNVTGPVAKEAAAKDPETKVETSPVAPKVKAKTKEERKTEAMFAAREIASKTLADLENFTGSETDFTALLKTSTQNIRQEFLKGNLFSEEEITTIGEGVIDEMETKAEKFKPTLVENTIIEEVKELEKQAEIPVSNDEPAEIQVMERLINEIDSLSPEELLVRRESYFRMILTKINASTLLSPESKKWLTHKVDEKMNKLPKEDKVSWTNPGEILGDMLVTMAVTKPAGEGLSESIEDLIEKLAVDSEFTPDQVTGMMSMHKLFTNPSATSDEEARQGRKMQAQLLMIADKRYKFSQDKMSKLNAMFQILQKFNLKEKNKKNCL
jgi:hypothetical protein